jgi:hypothetical protein
MPAATALAIKAPENDSIDDTCIFYTFEVDDTVRRASEKVYEPTLGDISKAIDIMGLMTAFPDFGASVSHDNVAKLLKKMDNADRLNALGMSPEFRTNDSYTRDDFRSYIFAKYNVNPSKLYESNIKKPWIFAFLL